MENKDNKKGDYVLIEDFFSGTLKSKLPVNLFLLREDKSEIVSLDNRSFVKNNFYRSDIFIVGHYYKYISIIK